MYSTLKSLKIASIVPLVNKNQFKFKKNQRVSEPSLISFVITVLHYLNLFLSMSSHLNKHFVDIEFTFREGKRRKRPVDIEEEGKERKEDKKYF